MTNVIPLRSTRTPDAGHAPVPDHVNPLAALVATIDKALGDTWSFDLVHHEVVGDETIVFAQLVIDGRHRIGIGGTSVKGTLVDRLNAAIRAYLVGLDSEAMSEADHRRTAEILTFATNMEHAGDVVDRNLLVIAGRSLKRGRALSAEQQNDLSRALERVATNLRRAASVVVNGDARAARMLAEEKLTFRNLENAATVAK